VVEASVLRRVVAVWNSYPRSIIVASHRGRRGHPTIFPWMLASRVEAIPEDFGLNWLLQFDNQRIVEVECPEASVLWDIDTPEDFSRLAERLERL
jgi:molybdenum cofactor cytidylyltransferase